MIYSKSKLRIIEGITQYRLQMAEKELIETTLVGSVKQLTDILALAQPHASRKSAMLRTWAQKIAKAMNIERGWEFDLAVMLSSVGLMGLPPAVLERVEYRRDLSPDEKELYDSAPKIGADIVSNVPRLENVAKGILYQNKNFDGTGFPKDEVTGHRIPVVARILKVINDIVDITDGHAPGRIGLEHLWNQVGKYDEAILGVAERILLSEAERHGRAGETITEFLPVNLLRGGVMLASDITYSDGHLILAKGCQLTDIQVQRILGIHKTRRVAEPIEVVYQANIA